jgi:hypothetical protein
MTNIRAICFSLAGILATFSAPTYAVADNITFKVQSMAEQRAQIVFYSQDRRYRWPGPGRAYNLNDYGEHEFKLNCITNEKICYGAWASNDRVTWGSGHGDNGGCSNCCYTCSGGGSTRLIVLRNSVSRGQRID